MNTSPVSRRGCLWWDGTFYGGGNQEEKKLSVNKSLLNDRDRQTRWEYRGWLSGLARDRRRLLSGAAGEGSEGREDKLIICWFGGKESPRSVVRGKFTTKLYFLTTNRYRAVLYSPDWNLFWSVIAESWCPANNEQRKFACKNLVWVRIVCCCKYL